MQFKSQRKETEVSFLVFYTPTNFFHQIRTIFPIPRTNAIQGECNSPLRYPYIYHWIRCWGEMISPYIISRYFAQYIPDWANAIRPYILSGISMPNMPIPVRRIFTTTVDNTNLKLFFTGSDSFRMEWSW